MNKKYCLTKGILLLLLIPPYIIHSVGEDNLNNNWKEAICLSICVGLFLTALVNGIDSINRNLNRHKIDSLKEAVTNGNYNESAAAFRILEERAEKAVEILNHLVDQDSTNASATFYLAQINLCIHQRRNECLEKKSECFI